MAFGSDALAGGYVASLMTGGNDADARAIPTELRNGKSVIPLGSYLRLKDVKT